MKEKGLEMCKDSSADKNSDRKEEEETENKINPNKRGSNG
jgi:hypothetical protein